MVHYKLCYFNVRGKAEGIRYIFAQAGVDFEDHRVSQDEWPQLKPSKFWICMYKNRTPMGQLPVLHVDSKVLCQSIAIARYIAKEYGKFEEANSYTDEYNIGKSSLTYEENFETSDMSSYNDPSADTPMGQLPVLHIDNKVLCQSMAIARYIAKEYGLIPSNHFLAAKADMIVDGLGDQYPNIRPYMMALMKGDADEALSWADLLVAEQLDRLILFNKSDSILAGHKHLAHLVKHVHELPNIKKYLASRPQTAM
uniref:glutathione transferase n=1 Tax=Romanomermis culicivorax TaxID=13658 RepID=A0A915K7L4_ROMCU